MNRETHPYFVMLYINDTAIPMMSDDDNVAFYQTRAEADNVASNNPLGERFGLDVFQLGSGE